MAQRKEEARAKLNLTLDVLARRDDGYHALCSVMQAVRLCDEVTVHAGTADGLQVRCRWARELPGGLPALPQDEENLAWRAAQVYCAETGARFGGLQIEIEKRIPSQAGLGGGSADAAAVLRALNALQEGRLSPEALETLGAAIGSDVPFCVRGGTALAQGRGEVLTRLPDAPPMYFVLCKPSFGVSTAALYQQLDRESVGRRPDTGAMLHALEERDVPGISRQLSNVFEPLVAREQPQVRELLEALSAHGALGARMTGSGSAVFGVFADLQGAKEAFRALRQKPCQVFLTESAPAEMIGRIPTAL